MRDLGISAVQTRPPEVDLKTIRNRLGLTQEEFAVRFGLPLANVRNWEQNRVTPDDAARTLLAVIAHHPGVVEETVAG